MQPRGGDEGSHRGYPLAESLSGCPAVGGTAYAVATLTAALGRGGGESKLREILGSGPGRDVCLGSLMP